MADSTWSRVTSYETSSYLGTICTLAVFGPCNQNYSPNFTYLILKHLIPKKQFPNDLLHLSIPHIRYFLKPLQLRRKVNWNFGENVIYREVTFENVWEITVKSVEVGVIASPEIYLREVLQFLQTFENNCSITHCTPILDYCDQFS